MHARTAGKHRLARIAHQRQIFVLDAHECGCECGGDVGFGCNERHAVAVVTHGVVAQHRLIGIDQSVTVMGYVFRGEYR